MAYSITQVTPETDFHLKLIYSDGVIRTVDFKPIIRQGGIFSFLNDPDFFKQVSLGDRGRYIEWPNEIDFCADALRESSLI